MIDDSISIVSARLAVPLDALDGVACPAVSAPP
jgi:hypothetical protein